MCTTSRAVVPPKQLRLLLPLSSQTSTPIRLLSIINILKYRVMRCVLSSLELTVTHMYNPDPVILVRQTAVAKGRRDSRRWSNQAINRQHCSCLSPSFCCCCCYLAYCDAGHTAHHCLNLFPDECADAGGTPGGIARSPRVSAA